MHKLATLALALAMLGTAGTALAQRIDDPFTSARYVGDEPNVLAPGSLPYDWTNDPSASYPADANGLGASRLASPGLVLASTFVHRYELGRAMEVPQTRLLNEFVFGKDIIMPGLGQFWAYYGTWQDLNGDGFLQDTFASNRVHVSVMGDCDTVVRGAPLDGPDNPGGTNVEFDSTTDDNGIGKPQGANTGLSARCVSNYGDEFIAADAPATGIVAYVTPGYHPYYGDLVNRDRNNDTHAPDFTFQGPIGTEGENTGRYWGPGSNFDYVMLDNSLLETTVLEAISEPVLVVDGDRTHEAGSGSLVEVDVYSSIDPLVESLYQTAVVSTLAAEGCTVDYTDLANVCPTTRDKHVDPITDPVFDAVPSTAAVTGPADDRLYPGWATEVTGFDHVTSPHLYLDLRIISGTSRSAVVLHSTDGSFGSEDYVGDGKYRVWQQIEIRGRLGVWQDLNADGFLGKPVTDEEAIDPDPCQQDPYECGNVDDPNSYSFEGSEGEYTPACGAKEAPVGKNAAGSFLATLQSSTGNWGLGAYVLTDRRTATNSNADTLRDDGRVPFNPYDDLVLDVADDGDVDSIVTSGPIQVHVLCAGTSAGVYNSYERVILLGGTVNYGFDVILTGETGGDFVAQGVPTGERVSDVDVYPAFTV